MNADVRERVRAAREALGWSRERLAADARVDVETLEGLEGGRKVPFTTAALGRIARVLGVPLSEFLSPGPQSPTPALYFRQLSVPDFASEDLPKVLRAIEIADAVRDLLRVLGREPLRHLFHPAKPRGDKPHAQAYQLARAVRDKLVNFDRPLGDLRSLIEDRFGVPVVEERLRTPSVAALTAKDQSGRLAAILINTASPRARWLAYQRIDLAHELAHVLFDAAEAAFALWIDRDAAQTVEALDVHTAASERRAKAFAAEFLAPEPGLRRLLGPAGGTTSTEAALDLATRAMHEFGLSPEVTANHLVNRRYVDEKLREWLAKQLPPPVAPVSNRASLLERLVAEAIERDAISEMRGREILGLTPWDDLPIRSGAADVPA